MKPVWPKLASDIAGMAEPAPRRPCQPRPRASASSGVRSRVSSRHAGSSHGRASAQTSRAVAKSPAWPETPPRRNAFPSWTSPRTTPSRNRAYERPRDATIARSNRSPRSVAAVGPGVARQERGGRARGPRHELRERPVDRRGEERLEDLRQEKDVQIAVDDALARRGLRLDPRERAPVGGRPFAARRRAGTRPAGPRCASAGARA